MNQFDGVICGDMDIVVDNLIQQGEKYDLILTDPPYNINKDFGNDSDKLSIEDFVEKTSERIGKLLFTFSCPLSALMGYSRKVRQQILIL